MFRLMDHPTTKMSESDTCVLEDAIESVYDRSDIYGKPEDSFRTIAEMWNSYLSAEEIDPNITPHDVANMMILLKVARNAGGNYHKDNWVDIAGYAECGAKSENE